MDFTRLIEHLSDVAAYPTAVDDVVVCHTHISAMFLAGRYAYKVKKPVDLGFLDFTTLAKRRHFCEEEVRLNRRLAPEVYLGVIPITLTEHGVRVEGRGEAVEWAVKMNRLSDDATLRSRARRHDLPPGTVEALAESIAAFHATAGAGERVSAFGWLEAVARNVRKNFEQLVTHTDTTTSRAVFNRCKPPTEAKLARHIRGGNGCDRTDRSGLFRLPAACGSPPF